MFTTPSEPSAALIIERLRAALSEDAVRQCVDRAFDEASAMFEGAPECADTQAQFLKTVGRFVKHLNRHALLAQDFSERQAQAEAVDLLSRYRNATDAGFEAALLDALPPSSALSAVLAQVLEIIKQRERNRYMRQVTVRELDCLSWPVKCAVAANLLSQLRDFLPERLANRMPAQLVNQIPDLITRLNQADALLEAVLTGAFIFRHAS